MKQSDFFKDIDDKIAHKAAREKQATQDLNVRGNVTRQAIQQIRPLLERYKEELAKRGIRATVSVGGFQGDTLSFGLHYTPGGEHGFVISNGTIQSRYFENGKSCLAQGGVPVICHPMHMDAFEKFLQTIVAEFMEESLKHGGFLSLTKNIAPNSTGRDGGVDGFIQPPGNATAVGLQCAGPE